MNEYTNYACVDGFRLEGGSVTKRCNKEAKWEGKDPICVGEFFIGIEQSSVDGGGWERGGGGGGR